MFFFFLFFLLPFLSFATSGIPEFEFGSRPGLRMLANLWLCE